MKKKNVSEARAFEVNPLYIWILRILSLVGIGMMVYLAKLHFASEIGTGSVCELGEGLSCEAVNTSEYSEILGIPISFMGIGFFSLVLLLSFRKMSEGLGRFFVLFTFFNLIPSAYLSVLELTVIKSICVFCEASKLIMLLMLGIWFWVFHENKKKIEGGAFVMVLIVGLISVFVMWNLQKGSAESDRDLTSLAQCMTDNGVIMYGSITCISCARERAYFGEAFHLVNEVECNPEGENAQVELCLEKGISHTPTFIREVDGEETGRLDGFQDADALAKFAGCEATLK